MFDADSTGISHRVRGVPDWNHEIFADDLSLYVSSKGETQRQKDASAESRKRVAQVLPQYTSKAVLQETQDLENLHCDSADDMHSDDEDVSTAFLTNSPIGGFSRDVQHVAETAVPTTLSPNLKLNAPNVSSPGFPMAFGTRAKSSRRSTVKLPSGS